ncbi:hypothetical protein CLV71_1283 [Actinophytocola oryzae]|uniref:Uncharacterized protein n=1 Tax=Actinophytocola oryzae TaxID=502181 RepID=A0A4V3FQD0_9PSEU|nr:hypothetical protein CLV71_1283 [Actinophytocola oryzae]
MPVPVVACSAITTTTATKVLEDSGIRVLEGEAVALDINGHRVGIARVKGFGGGFAASARATSANRR